MEGGTTAAGATAVGAAEGTGVGRGVFGVESQATELKDRPIKTR